MTAPTILVVDDQKQVREVLKSGLSAEGWHVRLAHDRASLFNAIQRDSIDLVTLDLMLGDEDGLSVAREIRQVRNLPIVIVSGKSEPFDRVEGLEAGADDYITKPFHIREVVIRIRKTLERYNGDVEIPSTIAFDHSLFDPKSNTVRHLDGRKVELTGMELEILKLFLHHPNRILSRDDISQALYGRNWDPTNRSIDVHIAHLRRKIEGAGEKPNLFRTVRGVGYVFSGLTAPAKSLI